MDDSECEEGKWYAVAGPKEGVSRLFSLSCSVLSIGAATILPPPSPDLSPAIPSSLILWAGGDGSGSMTLTLTFSDAPLGKL
jgi:hypothetical protein